MLLHPFVYVLLMAPFHATQQGYVIVTETGWAMGCKASTLCYLALLEKVCLPLF